MRNKDSLLGMKAICKLVLQFHIALIPNTKLFVSDCLIFTIVDLHNKTDRVLWNVYRYHIQYIKYLDQSI